ncbi:MAG: UDP-N-acetylglucosamine 2-epimerase (non-hydrolyzing) [Halioglobus sp.]|jgi:UDP-N-acetylglucosamine 2-epimerase (non-hydrolysing)
MIHVFIGTKAQLIKMAPVMAELQQRNIPYNFIFSGQHQATVHNIREEFGIKEPDITLYHGKDITGIIQMLLWSIRILASALWNRSTIWQGDSRGVVLNHGDTFSTLLGSLLARISGHRSAHVESGLRSFNFFHPFPEEITRIFTFWLSNIYYAPGEWALSNLDRYRGIKINTQYNTLLDSLRHSEAGVDQANVDIPDYSFALVSIHRFENIFSRSKLEEIVGLLIAASQLKPLVFILHKPTEKKLDQFGLRQKLNDCAKIELRPRYSYFEFIKLTRHASFVITDGGSNQEECHYIGKPCLIMRASTERQEGLGGNALICNYEPEKMTDFINNIESYASPSIPTDLSPSTIIVDHLESL